MPCYNEEACIADVIDSITQVLPEVYLIMVNDGSADNTARIISEKAALNDHVILLDLPINLGIGGAVQTAFCYAARNSFEYAVKVDGDGQHPVDQITGFLKHSGKKMRIWSSAHVFWKKKVSSLHSAAVWGSPFSGC